MKVLSPILVAFAATALFAPGSASAQGYQVQPMLATITPAGAGSRLTMSLKNTGSVPITLELVPFRATVDEAGKPSRADDLTDIMIYPPQTIVPPGKEQVVQVRYIGDPAIAIGRMYGVRVAQLPIDFATGTVGKAGASTTVKVSFNFLTHIIVSPAAAQPSLSLGSSSRSANGDLIVLLTNDGVGVAMLSETAIMFTDGAGKSVKIAAADLGSGDFGALMPKQARRITIAAKSLSNLTGTIKLDLTAK